MSNARANAYSALSLLKEYWRAYDQYDLKAEVHPGTFEIKSNMKNGYPPLRGK